MTRNIEQFAILSLFVVVGGYVLMGWLTGLVDAEATRLAATLADL